MKRKITRKILIALALVLVCTTVAAVKISLDSPVSFPVDI